jgi:hypothetical protein
MVDINSHMVANSPEAVEVKDIDIDTVVRRKSMLASAVFVIASSIENPVNANTDTVTPNAEVSAVDMPSIYQIRHSLLAKDFPVSPCFPVRAL